MKETIKLGTGLSPVPVVMVSCGGQTESNITTIAWTGVLNSEPPLVYISVRPTRYSYHIIKETEEFVLNIPDEKLVWETDFCGTKSGKEMDKFEEASLSKEQSKIVKCPSIQECPISIECKLKEVRHLGTHDMLIGEVVCINCKKEYLDEKGNIDYTKTNLLTYAGTDYFVNNQKVGERGICFK